MNEEVPPLVARAQALATELGFALTRAEALGQGQPVRRHGASGQARPSASLTGVGRFLAMLAAGVGLGHAAPSGGGRIGELGTGAGVGAAWIASAMPADARLITVEIDPGLAAAARGLFADDPRVQVLTGDSLELIAAHAPFDLVFADCAGDRARQVELLAIGGRLVVDDVTPRAALPPDSPYLDHDPKRESFFGDPRLVSVEVVLPDLRNSLLVGTRTR